MKRIVIALLVLMTIFSLANAQKQTTVINDSTGNVKVTVTKDKDAKTNAGNTAVTVVGMDDEDADTTHVSTSKASTPRGPHGKASISIVSDDDDFPFNNFGNAVGGGILVAIISIIAIFGMPVFIIFVVFFFRYKNRKARYRLAEQALAAGQPLPEGFIRESKPTDQRTQGIRNTFTGIGLFIFLWAITGEFGIGAIGLLVMFMGIGQWLVGYKQQNNQESTYRTSFTDREKNGRNTGTGNFNTRFTEEKTKLSIQSQSPPPRGTKQESRRKTTKRRTKKINEPTQRYITSRTGRGVQKHQGLRPVGAKVPVACQTFLPASDLR
ncbi:DUF6249 domain-containing protein [Bacteroides faecis]|uniref:DUF6249 domain-containing protein n=1 Tax=Bacteroides faecis TaxID=674529 RepID=UPI0035AD85A1|nr:DUF6249 domain-containing protein [Bacteroides faecis]